ncbi:MAG: helix-turn-helix domain-containing protein [Streptosporangiaceae bacterium]
MLRELNVVEQRYRAVVEVLSGTPVIEVAGRYGVARQTVHRWLARYQAEGLDGLADRSHAPRQHPWRIAAETEALICELRRAHGRWGLAAWSSRWAGVGIRAGGRQSRLDHGRE